jgi:transposase
MGKLSSHKWSAVASAIRAASALLTFLPPYSPDLNPIEQALSKPKTLLRKKSAFTLEQTTRCVGALLDEITPRTVPTSAEDWRWT